MQVKSRVSPHLEFVKWLYTESYEGKGRSDGGGGLVKQTFAEVAARLGPLEDGVGGEAADQAMAIAAQVRDRILAGLSFEDGRVGDFRFFR